MRTTCLTWERMAGKPVLWKNNSAFTHDKSYSDHDCLGPILGIEELGLWELPEPGCEEARATALSMARAGLSCSFVL